MKFPASGGGDFKNLPAGTHMAVCTQIVDIGLQSGSAMYPSPKQKVVMRFEVPSERIEFDNKDAPAVIMKEFTASMSEKSTLRKWLESWRGKKFTDDEASDFDVAKILGQSVMLSVVSETKNGKERSNIAGFSAMPKGIPPVKAEGEVFIHDAEHDNYDKLSNYLKKRLDERLDVQNAKPDNFTTVPPRSEQPVVDVEGFDEIPF